jgi:hypothetical protein
MSNNFWECCFSKPIPPPPPKKKSCTIKALVIFFLVENIFIKRIVCICCESDLSITTKTCSKCANNNCKRLALIFDSTQEIIFTRTYDRLSSIINSYRETFTKQKNDTETNDIVFNRNYKILRDSINYPFISIILHLDGISLGKSKKISLWIISCSIVELPPAVRNCRQNNIILSLWIGKEQPNVNLWLDRCFCQLADIKRKGKSTI